MEAMIRVGLVLHQGWFLGLNGMALRFRRKVLIGSATRAFLSLT